MTPSGFKETADDEVILESLSERVPWIPRRMMTTGRRLRSVWLLVAGYVGAAEAG
jgi:hypothetical protein